MIRSPRVASGTSAQSFARALLAGRDDRVANQIAPRWRDDANEPAEKRYRRREAYSDAQGWVEGVLQTADLMLDKLGLSPA